MASAAELRVEELELELARTRGALDRLNRMGGGGALKLTAMPPLRTPPPPAEAEATAPASKKQRNDPSNAGTDTGAPGPDEGPGERPWPRGWGVCDRAALIMAEQSTAKARHKTVLR